MTVTAPVGCSLWAAAVAAPVGCSLWAAAVAALVGCSLWAAAVVKVDCALAPLPVGVSVMGTGRGNTCVWPCVG